MRTYWTPKFAAASLGVALALAPSTSQAAVCGDLNNDGNVTIVDVVRMANCVAGLCTPSNECGGAGLANCGDTYGDGSTGIGQTDDLNQLVFKVAGLETLHDLCAPVGGDISCPGNAVTLTTGAITSSQHWPASCTVTIAGTVTIDTPPGGPTTVLTVDAGSTVLGQKGTVDPAALIVLPGAKISAIGTASQPIVFTSDQAEGARGKGDWGGVMINGQSTVNRPNCLNTAEGVAEAYGGCDVNDSSGGLQYVRIEYAGRLFTPNNELNAFTMNGVGRGTTVNHIQANVGADDCIEWFGGTVNADHLVASGCADDGFDWQLGFTGTLQYGLYIANGTLTDTANGRDSRGIEADNSEFGNNDLPRSNPKMCNLTLVGSRSQSDNGGSDTGILFRRGTAATVANIIVTGFQDSGVELRDASTTQVACVDANTDGTPESLTGDLVVRSAIFYENGSFPGAGTEQANVTAITGATKCQTATWYGLLPDVTADGSNPVNPNISTAYPASNTLFDARPTAPFVSAPAVADCSAISDVFQDSGYIGAMDPNGPAYGWLSTPWNSFDIN